MFSWSANFNYFAINVIIHQHIKPGRLVRSHRVKLQDMAINLTRFNFQELNSPFVKRLGLIDYKLHAHQHAHTTLMTISRK